MFLAIKEIKHEKLRYCLVMVLIFLVSYLLIILSGLSSGLANLNKSAVIEWGAKTIILNKDAEGRLAQSFLTPNMITNSEGTPISQYNTILKNNHNLKENTTIIGLEKTSFVAKNLSIIDGKFYSSKGTIVVSDKFKKDGYKLGDELNLSNSDVKLRIVGFIQNATLSAAPVVYTSMETMRPINNGTYNAVLSTKTVTDSPKGTIALTQNEFIQKLPGYSAQNLTFNFMIGFLYIIVFIVISIFLYILTVQKMSNYGVMKAQGISTSYLVLNTIVQSAIVAVFGTILATILSYITSISIPSEVPISISINSIGYTVTGVILMSLLGSIIPVYQIIKVDPYQIIGG